MEAVVQQGLVEVMFAAAHESGFGRQLSAPHQTCQLSRVQETGSPSEQRDDFMRAFDPILPSMRTDAALHGVGRRPLVSRPKSTIGAFVDFRNFGNLTGFH